MARRRTRKRRSGWMWLGAAAVVAALGSWIWLLLRPHGALPVPGRALDAPAAAGTPAEVKGGHGEATEHIDDAERRTLDRILREH